MRYVINKKDSLADNKVSLPLAGAEFGLFEEKYLPFLKTASKDALLGMAHDYGVTDAKGQVRFSGEAYDSNFPTENIYYLMEMEAPTGYKRDRRIDRKSVV